MKDKKIFNDLSIKKDVYKVDDILRLAYKFCEENDDIIYCIEESCFYLWEDNYYKPKYNIQVEQYLLKQEEFTYLSTAGLKNLMHRISVIKQVSLDQLNANEMLDLENGTLDMSKGKFMEHKRDNLSTIRIPYKYDKDAKCPEWIKFLNSSLEGKSAEIAVLQEFIGYCLGRDISFHKSLILMGEGRNGKGTTFYIIEKLLGERNTCNLTLDQLNRSFMVAELSGKLVNIDGDASVHSKDFESNFRRIVAGDSVTAEKKGKDPFTFTPYVKMIIGANDLPRISDRTHGFYDRLIILDFNISFAGREDRDLKKKLSKELSGILNWALEGRKRLYKQKAFSLTKTMQDAVLDVKKENNPIEIYIDEHIGVVTGCKITKKKIYDNYMIWCKESGHHAMSKVKFGKEFYRILKEWTKKDSRDSGLGKDHIWENIYLKSEGEPSFNTKDVDWE